MTNTFNVVPSDIHRQSIFTVRKVSNRIGDVEKVSRNYQELSDGYTSREVLEILFSPDESSSDARVDIECALARVRQKQRDLLLLMSAGYTINEASKLLDIKKQYRFYRNAVRAVVRQANGGNK